MQFHKYLEDALSYNGYTPDVPELETQEAWPVFTYADRRGKSSAYFTHVDSECKFLGIGWTKSAIYNILTIEDGDKSYKLAHPAGADRILGELWMVHTEDLLELDSDEKNLLVTKRLKVPIVLPKHGVINAWMYITARDYLLHSRLKISKHTGCTYIGTSRFLEIH